MGRRRNGDRNRRRDAAEHGPQRNPAGSADPSNGDQSTGRDSGAPPAPEQQSERPAGRAPKPDRLPRADHGERSERDSLRGIAGSGPSQVGPMGAMRARDVSRPRPEDVARAIAATLRDIRGHPPTPGPDLLGVASRRPPASDGGQGTGSGGSSAVSS